MRARFKSNPTALSDFEVLELLLGYVILRKDTKALAKELLDRFGNLRTVLDASEQELLQIHGIGPEVTLFWKLLRELRCRYVESELLRHKARCDPSSVASMARLRLVGNRLEELWIALVDSQHHLLSWQCLSQGTVDGVLFYRREIIRIALEAKAWGFFLVHNHPGGNIMPSSGDTEFTKSLKESTEQVEIRMIDHIILTANSAYSIGSSNIIMFDEQLEGVRTSNLR